MPAPTSISAFKRPAERLTFQKLLLDPNYFKSAFKRNYRLAASLDTSRYRYPLHKKFLRANRAGIKVFYDIGAANFLGAPTTIDAKHALGKHSAVVAVDLIKAQKRERKKIKRARVSELLHAITLKPLPVQCDAIRFANVSQYMKRGDVIRALNNIWQSLKPGGYLLGAVALGSFTDREFVLQKVPVSKENPTGFVEIKFEEGFAAETPADKARRTLAREQAIWSENQVVKWARLDRRK